LQTKYLFAESLGVFGGSLAFTALGLLLGLGGDPLTLALLAALPFDLLSGLLLDRLDRRALLLAGVWVRAGLLLLLALLPKGAPLRPAPGLPLPGRPGFRPPRLARPPGPPGPGAAGAGRGRLQAAQLLGDSLGDLLAPPLLLLAKPLPFALGGLLLVAEGLLLRGLPAFPPPKEAKEEGVGPKALLAGVGFLLADKRLLPLTLYALALNLLSTLGLALLPLLALEGGVPPALYGLYPLGLSFGGFLGSLLAGSVGPGLGIWGGHGLRLLGLAALFLPFPLVLLGPFLVGAGGSLSGVHLRAYRQRLAPEALLGRVQAGAIALTSAASLLGALLAGILGGLGAGLPLGLAVLGLFLLLPLALGSLHPRQLEALRREGG